MKFNHDKFDERVLEAIRRCKGDKWPGVARHVLIAWVDREDGDPMILSGAISKSLARLQEKGVVVKLGRKNWRLA